MIGLGIDLCEIVRMQNILEKSESFISKYFSPDEQNYIKSRANMGAASAAAMFAAKEAFLKATGLGIGRGILLDDIIVTHNDLGAPAYLLSGSAEIWMKKAGATKAYLSLTHEAGVAGAVCIIE